MYYIRVYKCLLDIYNNILLPINYIMANKLPSNYECPFDVWLLQIIIPQLKYYYSAGLTPNNVTTMSIIFGVLSAYCIYIKYNLLAAILLMISYYFDCVDGALARKYNMVTKFGDYYDHIGDLFKLILITISLYITAAYKITNSSMKSVKVSSRHKIYTIILIITFIIQSIHIGFQECIYNKKNESSFLNIIRECVNYISDNPHSAILYTRHMGCGHWYLLFAIIIAIWNKK